MKPVRQLTTSQMARRVLRYVPELSYPFVMGYLLSKGPPSLSETDAHAWVQFFDRFVIDERNGDLDDDFAQGWGHPV